MKISKELLTQSCVEMDKKYRTAGCGLALLDLARKDLRWGQKK